MSQDNHRYTRFDGLSASKPLWQTFYQAAYFRAGAAATALALGAEYLLGGSNLLNTALWGLGYTIGCGSFTYICENKIYQHLFKPEQCIDTKPNNFSPPTCAEDMAKTLSLRNALAGCAITLAFIAFASDPDVFLKSYNLLEAISRFLEAPLMIVPMLGSIGSAMLRFNKVASGKYTITNTPIKQSAPKDAQQALALQAI